MKRCILIATVFSCLATPSHAGLTEGIAAATVGNYAQALAEFEPLAAAGDPAGQYYLAKLYLEGHAPTNDVKRGVELMMNAAKGSYPEAQAQLGLMYAMGLGVPVDNAAAYDWLTKAMTALPDGTRRSVADSNRNAVLQRMTEQQRTALGVSTTLPLPAAQAAAEPESAPAPEASAEPEAALTDEAATVVAAAEPAPIATPEPTATTPKAEPSASAVEAVPTPKPIATEMPAESTEAAAKPDEAAEPATVPKPAPVAAMARSAPTVQPQPKPNDESTAAAASTAEAKADSPALKPAGTAISAGKPLTPVATQTADTITGAPNTTTAKPAAATESVAEATTAKSTALKPVEPTAAAKPAEPTVTQIAAKDAATTEPSTKPTEEKTSEAMPARTQDSTAAQPAAKATQVASAATPEAAPKAGTGKGNVRIQVASLPSEDAAWAAWTQISKEFSDQVSGLTASIETADLGQQGTFYRLQTGPFDTIAEAKDRCVKMKESGLDCLVVGKE